MTDPDHDDGLVHGHDWASNPGPSRDSYPQVADAAEVNTPSSAFHDDFMHAE